jgi:hypothetical protein
MITTGVISLTQWCMAPDGMQYIYFFHDAWKILTDKNMPVEDFRSAERWSLAAYKNHEIIALFPGCKITGYIKCDRKPVDLDARTFDLTK